MLATVCNCTSASELTLASLQRTNKYFVLFPILDVHLCQFWWRLYCTECKPIIFNSGYSLNQTVPSSSPSASTHKPRPRGNLWEDQSPIRAAKRMKDCTCLAEIDIEHLLYHSRHNRLQDLLNWYWIGKQIYCTFFPASSDVVCLLGDERVNVAGHTTTTSIKGQNQSLSDRADNFSV